MSRDSLVERLRLRDPVAESTLAEVFGPPITKYLRRIVSSAAVAEDLTQEVFLRFLSKRPAIQNEAHLRSWLYRVAFNIAATHRRRRRVEQEAFGRLTYEVKSGAEAEKSPLDMEIYERALAAAEQLREPFRQTFALCAIDGLDYATAAAQLGCPKKTVNTRMYRAWSEIRRQLSQESTDE